MKRSGTDRASATARPTGCLFFLVLDVAAVLVFVGIGRSVHSKGVSLDGVASTAWPFLVGLLAGWSAAFGLGRPLRWREGVATAVICVAIGMTLRVLVGQGTAVPFVAVALGFLGATMVGWRLVLGIAGGSRPRLSQHSEAT